MKLVQSLAAPVVAGLVVLMASCNRARADDLPTFVTSELEALEKKHQEALTVARKPLTDLKEKYVEALKRTGDAARAAGNHTKVEVFENEMKRLKSGAGHDNPMKDPDPVLDELRNTYTEHHAKREVEVLGMVAKVERSHADALAEIVGELRQAGMIAEAKQVFGLEQAARESIKQLDAKILALSKLPRDAVQGEPEGLGNVPASMKKRCSKADRYERLKNTGGTPECEDAVIRALNWIKQTQKEDGSWTSDFPVAMTGFALLAFLGHCETPQSPEYGENVSHGITYLINVGLKNKGRLSTKDANSNLWVYEHGIATYALAEAYIFCNQLNIDIPELDNVTRNAVDMIMDGQGESGGWVYRYAPTNVGDNSVGFWQIQALKAAKHTGLVSESKLTVVARKALNWLDKAQGKDGAIGYRSDSKQSPGLTGGGVLAFQMWDMGGSRNARAGIHYIGKNTGFNWGISNANLYYHYYNAQAMINEGGSEWNKYNKMFREELLKNQMQDGSWDPPKVLHGPVNTHMATCLSALMLEVYYRFLP